VFDFSPSPPYQIFGSSKTQNFVELLLAHELATLAREIN
jgi:hypothetical protein